MNTLIDLTQVNAQVDDMHYCVNAISQIESMFQAIIQACIAGDVRQIQNLAKIGIQITEIESNHLDVLLEQLKSLVQMVPSVH